MTDEQTAFHMPLTRGDLQVDDIYEGAGPPVMTRGMTFVRRLVGLGISMALLTACGGGGLEIVWTSEPVGTTYAPAAVYALTDPGESAASMSQLAALPSVDGLAYRARWRDLEPAEGVYDWTTLDAAFDAVRGKRLTVHIGVSGGAWPDWLARAGAVTYGFAGPLGRVTDPLPWDAVFLNRYDNFVAALAAHVRGRGDMGSLNAISVGAPVSEMSLLGCQNNLLGGFAYGRTSYLSAWASTIGSHRDRFGAARILVSAPVGVICQPDNDGSAFYSAVLTAARAGGGNVAIFAADLNALGSSRVGQLDPALRRQFELHLQTIWSATNDPGHRMAGSLQDAVCQGLRLGAGYFELYKSDLSSADAAIRRAIDSARTGRGCP